MTGQLALRRVAHSAQVRPALPIRQLQLTLKLVLKVSVWLFTAESALNLLNCSLGRLLLLLALLKRDLVLGVLLEHLLVDGVTLEWYTGFQSSQSQSNCDIVDLSLLFHDELVLLLLELLFCLGSFVEVGVERVVEELRVRSIQLVLFLEIAQRLPVSLILFDALLYHVWRLLHVSLVH